MLDKVVQKLSQYFNHVFIDFEGMYVFGDSVDGKIHEDIELAAIFGTEDKSKREQIWPVVGKVETEMDVSIDLYPYTQESFKQDKEIYDEVMEAGIFYNSKGIRQN